MSPEPIINWKSWPFVERPYTSFFLLSFLILLAVLLYQITVFSWAQPLYYVIGMSLVLLNLIPYFIPTDYKLYDDKYIIYYLFVKVSRPYSDFGCFYQDKHGIMLSTFKMPRRLDTFRGQSLRFSKTRSEQEELVQFLTTKIGKKY
ncbi:MAG: hypothetical protein CVU50_08395 [Candidatus Cloacimonetes bacterium HGW-Cloacimonetes-3]|nr:MAG: hypothetical protein CVU50_08395 [Candidatus Cloacimonetes bacterium HGW-Cloacimonetes-3]